MTATSENDPQQWSDEIRDCVARADLAQAIKLLIDFVREFCNGNYELEDDVVLLSMKFHQVENEIRRSMMDESTSMPRRVKIAQNILQTLRLAKNQIRKS